MRKIQTSAFDSWCLRQVKEERQQQKEAEKRTDEKDIIKLDQILDIPLNQFGFCFLSLFFYLTKTLSVESACLFFSSFFVHWWVHFPSSFPHVPTSPAVTRFFFTRARINRSINRHSVARRWDKKQKHKLNSYSIRTMIGTRRLTFRLLTNCFSSAALATSRSGELRTQKLKSHLVRTQSLNVLPLKPWVGQYRAIHATLTARDFSSLPISTLPVHSPAFFQNLSRFFLCWLWLTHGSCVGL